MAFLVDRVEVATFVVETVVPGSVPVLDRAAAAVVLATATPHSSPVPTIAEDSDTDSTVEQQPIARTVVVQGSIALLDVVMESDQIGIVVAEAMIGELKVYMRYSCFGVVVVVGDRFEEEKFGIGVWESWLRIVVA